MCVRDRRQNKFVTLSGIRPLREGGGKGKSAKRDEFDFMSLTIYKICSTYAKSFLQSKKQNLFHESKLLSFLHKFLGIR